MLLGIDDATTVSAAVEYSLAYQVDAVIALVDLPSDDAERLAHERVPIVLYNRSSADYKATSVGCDHYAAGRTLATHVMRAGHRHVALIGGPAESVLAAERAAGFAEMLARNQDAPRLSRIAGDFGYASGRAAARTVLAMPSPPTAVVAVNDLMAIGAIDGASDHGLRVPHDVAVAGFDGIAAGNWAPYRITTMRQPLQALAAAAVDAALALIRKPDAPAERRIFACDLHVDHSTGQDRGGSACDVR